MIARPYRMHLCNDWPGTDDSTLAVIHHGTSAQPPAVSTDAIQVDMPRLDGPCFERWQSTQAVSRGREGRIRFAENGQVLFGHVVVGEDTLADTDRGTMRTYARIDRLLQQRGYPNWLRVWNHIGHIHRGEGDLERYRQFSAGRSKALSLKPAFEFDLPAATAVGKASDGFSVYFLAGRVKGIQIENPRQVSAFRYPRQYGPRSPSFSRALLLPWSDGSELMVSGTASVVGHETLHVGDARAQMNESIANMREVLAAASRRAGLREADPWRAELLKLYVRDPAHHAPCSELLAAAFPGTPLLVMHSDICRSDLSVEFEGNFLGPVANPAPG